MVLDDDSRVMAGWLSGMPSRGYRGAIMAGQQKRVVQYHEMVDRYIDGYRPQPKGVRVAA